MKFFMISICLCCLSCSVNEGQIKKINGISVVASSKKISKKNISSILNIKANYAAIMPFGFIKEVNHPNINYNLDMQWYGETKAGAKQYIEALHKHNISVMLKPQIWISHGVFTGHLKMTNEKDWLILEKSYTNFILDYARLAQETQVPIFCMGTELELFIKNRPQYWKSLIQKIRNIYDGKITYAANWNEYANTPFWKQLDYIGIDAYFPLSEEKDPTVQQLKKKWEKHKEIIKKHSDSIHKKILFTEFGYRSIDYTTHKPWDADYTKKNINLKAQSIAIQSLFEVFWNEKWFAGGFLWKWFIDYQNVGGKDNNRFTPQNKPAELIVKKHYQTK